jgi:hypothetical protein
MRKRTVIIVELNEDETFSMYIPDMPDDLLAEAVAAVLGTLTDRAGEAAREYAVLQSRRYRNIGVSKVPVPLVMHGGRG